MNFQELHHHLEQKFDGAITRAESDAIDPWIEVAPERWFEVAKVLRNDPQLAFDYLNCISGIDFCEPDAKKAAKVSWQPHVEVVYHLSSLTRRHRLVVKLLVPRWKDDQPGELPQVPSVTSLWSTANWHEREVYDLVGVEFSGHPDLRRILCPEDWLGHPLRKDYQMPLEYHGIRGR
ncbi:NADH-quinone oxidoreductase subunit C [Aeoliella sp. SH292]|uniref:NADH-quinone oxidoreductase subunit C n=1 Tax=Aeoliella sp. SH292 TaxID=3454464 RepID=UPI003F94D489